MSEWALPEINLLLCNHCGHCVDQCPGHAVEMRDEAPAIVRPADCSYCAICETICPVSAITCPYEIVWGD